MAKIPSKAQWSYSEPLSWDEETAIGNFLGVDIDSAVKMLEDKAHYYQEDFYYMPIIPFQFYIQAYINYLISEVSVEDSDAASSFISLIKWHIKETTGYLHGIEREVRACLEYVAHNQSKYDADVDIYGNFHNTIGKFINRLITA